MCRSRWRRSWAYPWVTIAPFESAARAAARRFVENSAGLQPMGRLGKSQNYCVLPTALGSRGSPNNRWCRVAPFWLPYEVFTTNGRCSRFQGQLTGVTTTSSPSLPVAIVAQLLPVGRLLPPSIRAPNCLSRCLRLRGRKFHLYCSEIRYQRAIHG